MKAILVLALSFQGFGLPFACINTTYSRTDEVEITDDLGHLIVGAFAHHGKAFYEHEVTRCLALLENDANHFDARNDLGAAYTKLDKWDHAFAAFEENEKRHPGKYETASNLGVMYKKMGAFEKAEASIRKALQIKPGGHMGLGDYYLQMIRWRQEQKGSADSDNATSVAISDDEFATPTKNFLGVPYEAGTEACAKIANKEFVITLIKNDVAFCDAYLVLGDILFEQNNFQMALRAYSRASGLTHGQVAPSYRLTTNDRRKAIFDIWRAEAKSGYLIEDGRSGQLQEELEAAKLWLEQYQDVERELIEVGRDVSFVALNSEAERRGIEKPRLLEAGYYEGSTIRADGLLWLMVALGVFAFVAVLLAIGVVVAIVLFVRRSKLAPGKKVTSG